MAQFDKVVTPAYPSTVDVHVATWGPAKNVDTFVPLNMAEQSDRSVQIDGTFNGAVAGIEGSLDGVTYFTLHDPQGVAISGSSARLSAILELVAYVRPFISGGDGSTAVIFRLLAKKAK